MVGWSGCRVPAWKTGLFSVFWQDGPGKDLTQLAIGGFSEIANEGVGFGLGFAMTLGEVATGGPVGAPKVAKCRNLNAIKSIP